jgi:hypothetical protein
MPSRGHKHRAHTERGPYGFASCVAGAACNQRAHGGVMWVETCSCGAERRVNSTGPGRTERGPWMEETNAE